MKPSNLQTSILFVGTSVFLSFISTILVFIFFVAISSLYIARRLKTDIIFATIIGILLCSIVAGLSTIVGTFLLNDASLSIIISIVLSLLSGYFIWKMPSLKIIKPDWKTYISLGFALGLFLLFLFTPLRQSGGVEFLSFLSAGEDNISHFSIFNYILQFNQPAYGQDENIWKGLANYPQSIHAFFAYIAHGIDQFYNLSIKQLLYFYYAGLSLAVACIGFLVCKIALSSYKPGVLSTIYAALVIFTVTSLILIPLVKHGYLAQSISILYCLVLFYFAYSLNKKEFLILFVIFALAASGVLMSWYLGAVALIPFGLYLLFKNYRYLKLIITGAVVMIIGLAAPLLHIIWGRSTDALSGSIGDPFGLSWIIYGCVIATAFLLLYEKKLRVISPLSVLVYGSIAMLLIFAVVMGFFGIGPNYFFFKLGLIVLLFCLTYSVYMFALLDNKAIQAILIGIVSVSCVIYSFSGGMHNTYIHFISKSKFNTFLSKEQTQEISPVIYGELPSRQDTLYISTCNRLGEYMLNRWIGALIISENDTRRSLEEKAYKTGLDRQDISNYRGQYSANIIQSAYCPSIEGL